MALDFTLKLLIVLKIEWKRVRMVKSIGRSFLFKYIN